MIEARAFIDNIEPARKKLQQLDAVDKGKYTIIDTIYRSVDPAVALTDAFLRLREIPENIWEEKEVILALKQTNLQKIGKISDIPLKQQFDTKAEAEKYYNTHLKDKFTYDFSFSRIGWQYILPGGDVVDIEIIESSHPTIELKSTTDEGIQKLLDTFEIDKADIITGPSVVAVKQILNL